MNQVYKETLTSLLPKLQEKWSLILNTHIFLINTFSELDCGNGKLKAVLPLSGSSYSTGLLYSLLLKPYIKGVSHSQEVGWWRTLMVECVTLIDYILKKTVTLSTIKLLHHSTSQKSVSAFI